MKPPARDPLAALFTHSVPPFAAADLGRGARLLVPNGAGFGTPQLWADGVPYDWVRGRADGYWIEGDRGSQHAGVDFGFYVRGREVFHLPEGLPVRAPCAGVLEAAGKDADPEPGPGGVVIGLGERGRPRLYVHLTDFRVRVARGARVKAGDVLGETVRYSRRYPLVVVHFGTGVLVPGAPPNPFDPTPLLRRWKVRHPVAPASTCNAAVLNRGRPGRFTAPGAIVGEAPVATWRPEWRDVWT